MTEEEFEETFNILQEQYKELLSSLDDVASVYSIEFITDRILSLYIDLNRNDGKIKKVLKFFKNVKSNSLLQKLYPWFNKDFFLINFLCGSFCDDLFKNYPNIWYGKIPSKKDYSENYIACFGEDNEWAYELGKRLNKNVEIYGEEDSSVDTITRYIWQYLQYKKPDAIFIIFPDIKRVEFFNDDDKLVNLLPDKKNGNSEFDQNYNSLYTKANNLLKFLQNYLLIKITCKNKNIPFYWYTTSEDLLSTNFDKFSNNEINIENTYSDGEKLIDLSPINNTKIVDIFYEIYRR